MYSKFVLAKKYIQYYVTAANGKGHGIHSPFVFDFVKNVLNDTRDYPAYQKVEFLREQLLKDHTRLEVEDMGAGSVALKNTQKEIAAIARHAAKPKKLAQLLFRIVQYYEPATIIEMGTSLGLTTSYLALAGQSTPVVTLEGAHMVAEAAKRNFKRLSLGNVELKEGNFDYTLEEILKDFSTIDFVFVDGNHRKAPTLRYFKSLIGKCKSSSILVFDDIHWSSEMEEAWEEIKAHPAVKASIDLFFLGLIFFRDEFKIKQHFVIRF